MKKVTLIMGALALVFGLSQCRKPNAPTINGIGETQHIIINASNGNDGSKVNPTVSGAVLGLTWETEDEITVTGGATGTLTLTNGAGETAATFEGVITKVNDNDLIFTCGSVDYTNQEGDLAWIKSNIRLVGTSEYKSDGKYENVPMELPYAILKLDLSYLGSTTKADDGATVTVKVGDSEIAKIINVKSISTEMYVALPIEGESTEKAYEFSSTNGKTITFNWTLDGNTFFTADGTSGGSIKPVETDEWINFNDAAMGVTGLLIWSKKNLGATCSTENPTDTKTAATWYGDYYAWAGVAPYYTSITWNTATTCSPSWKSGYSDGYSWAHCPYTNGTYSNDNKAVFTKYVPQNKATTYGYNNSYYDVKTVLDLSDPCDDAARAVLGGAWRMPTGGGSGEWKQLKDNTLFVWTTSYKGISGLAGYVVYKVKATAHKGQCATSSGNGDCNYSGIAYALTDPHMFLPAAGYFDGTSLNSAGSGGYYWSGSLYSVIPNFAWGMYFNSGNVFPQSRSFRCYGYAVRPVQ